MLSATMCTQRRTNYGSWILRIIEIIIDRFEDVRMKRSLSHSCSKQTAPSTSPIGTLPERTHLTTKSIYLFTKPRVVVVYQRESEEAMNFLSKSSPLARQLFCTIIRSSSQSVNGISINNNILLSLLHRREQQLIMFNNQSISSLYRMGISPMNNVNSTKRMDFLSFVI